VSVRATGKKRIISAYKHGTARYDFGERRLDYKGLTFSYSQKQRLSETRLSERRLKTERRKRRTRDNAGTPLQAWEAHLSMFNSRTFDPQRLAVYIAVFMAYRQANADFYNRYNNTLRRDTLRVHCLGAS
jgi:hypothetical protein